MGKKRRGVPCREVVPFSLSLLPPVCPFQDLLDIASSGPAEALYEKPYFISVKEALKPGGIMCMQGGCGYMNF